MQLKSHILIALFLAIPLIQAQNTAENILGGKEGLIIGGYGQIDGNFQFRR